jgi:hypothetical protein
MTTELCPCGRELHYEDPETERYVRAMVAEDGPTVKVRTSAGAWYVPRHYLALHGFTTARLPELAQMHGWRKE